MWIRHSKSHDELASKDCIPPELIPQLATKPAAQAPLLKSITMKFLALVLAAFVATTISVEGGNSPVHRQLPPGENGYQPSDGGRLNSTAAAAGSNSTEYSHGGRNSSEYSHAGRNSSEYGNRNKSGYSHGSRGEYGGRKNETVTQIPAVTTAAPASGASTAMAVGTAAAFITAVAAVL